MKRIFAVLSFCVLLINAVSAQHNNLVIDVKEKIELGGTRQWIMARGTSADNPIILFLHGGPGFPESPMAYIDSKELEKHFIVVNWDQRGCGKSADENFSEKSITMEQLLSDTKELVDYLKSRFSKQKIFLIGHSWGSILGLMTVRDYPDDFYAYVGIGQVIDLKKGETISYRYVLEKAKESGDTASVAKLERIGYPPYKGEGDVGIQRAILAKYNGVFKSMSFKDVIRIISESPDYSSADKKNLMPAFSKINGLLWPQVMSVNILEAVKKVVIPVYFFEGRYDYNCPFELVQQYNEVLEAPSKEIVWFNNSGHWINIEEPAEFQKALISKLKIPVK